jgi:hypothetical protein
MKELSIAYYKYKQLNFFGLCLIVKWVESFAHNQVELFSLGT